MDTLQDLYLSEIADSVYYVALSNKPLLKMIRQIETTDNSIILNELESSLKLYDFSGSFKGKIGDIGRGGGEYIQPIWTVNRKTDTVYLYAPFVRPYSLLTYKLSDSGGKLTGRITDAQKMAYEANTFHSVGNNILSIADIGKYSVHVPELRLYNPQTNTIIDSLINYYSAGRVRIGSYTFAYAGYKDESFYMSVYSDTLYRVTEKEIAPFAIFDFGKYKFPINITLLSTDNRRQIINRTIKLRSILRISSVLYLKFEYERGACFTYALNLNDKTVRYCKPYFINDLDNGPDYVNFEKIQTCAQIIDIATLKVTLSDDEIGSKWPYRMPHKDRLFPKNKMAKKLKNVDEFQRLFDKSTEESNPIIQFFKFKD